MDPGDQSQVIKLGNKCLTHLDILPAPNYITQTDKNLQTSCLSLSVPPQHWGHKHTTGLGFF